jgi:spoIIIJ-associated protein
VEWIESSGRTVDEAIAAAAQELGVAPEAVEHEVIDAGKPGLFGRTRVDARIRARVAATRPRRSAPRRSASSSPASPASPAAEPAAAAQAPQAEPRRAPSGSGDDVDQPAVAAEAIRFLEGLFAAIGVDVTIDWYGIDDETLQVEVTGANLGFLVGRGGQTLQAVQDLVRLRVHHALGARSGRLMLDIGGYRQKRKVALEEFTDRVAADVVASGERRAMEPMAAVDRKVVHARVGEIEGVRSASEGEEPNRRVVLLPA